MRLRTQMNSSRTGEALDNHPGSRHRCSASVIT